jgi:hypothetical protein
VFLRWRGEPPFGSDELDQLTADDLLGQLATAGSAAPAEVLRGVAVLTARWLG